MYTYIVHILVKSENSKAKVKNCMLYILQMKAAYRALDAFCELPDETRAKYERVSPDNNGYVKPGTEK